MQVPYGLLSFFTRSDYVIAVQYEGSSTVDYSAAFTITARKSQAVHDAFIAPYAQYAFIA